MRVWMLLLVGLMFVATPSPAQGTCGVVDAIDYPIDNLVQGYDDFALFRARFEGNHTGIDVGFDRWGDPVRAAARGRVTLSDIEEWDTEKGVVILEHLFPDGSIAYTLYGHMEQTDTIFFPKVGDCVERGAVIGSIGWPSRGRPHLHYEIRAILPTDGGPGYVTGNPLLGGWYHPLDFTYLWRIRLSPGFIASTTFDMVPGLPPVSLDSGFYALASGNTIQGTSPSGEILWQIETDGVVTGIAALPGDRVVAHTNKGQAITLQGGRYAALWTVNGLEMPFVALGETLVFVQAGGALAAYDPTGLPRWMLPAPASSARVLGFETNGQQIALGVHDNNDITWRLIDAAGQVVYETRFDHTPVIAPVRDGSWFALDGAQVKRFAGGENHTLGSISPLPGRTARVTVDLVGNAYVYMGDADNTLLALNPSGGVRWRADYPFPPASLPPLIRTGSGCLLYTLDADGMLNVFNTADGTLIQQVQLYAGGDQTGSPRARLLRVDTSERVQVSGGFLSLVTLDGLALGGEAANCLLG